VLFPRPQRFASAYNVFTGSLVASPTSCSFFHCRAFSMMEIQLLKSLPKSHSIDVVERILHILLSCAENEYVKPKKKKKSPKLVTPIRIVKGRKVCVFHNSSLNLTVCICNRKVTKAICYVFHIELPCNRMSEWVCCVCGCVVCVCVCV
jgi:hypothetical protein